MQDGRDRNQAPTEAVSVSDRQFPQAAGLCGAIGDDNEPEPAERGRPEGARDSDELTVLFEKRSATVTAGTGWDLAYVSSNVSSCASVSSHQASIAVVRWMPWRTVISQ